jgi:selenide, water dikinase
VLRQLPRVNDPNLLVGIDTADDAGVYKLSDTTALIQTVDFFTPVVDDPYLFGQIAAANSLSDVYAMGGKPLTALNIVAFPSCSLAHEILLAILQGGQDKVTEAGAVIVGGHTVEDAEPKYGLSVTGLIHPDKIWTNAAARPGDRLLLTKPLGTGVLATAARAEMFPAGVAAAAKSMATLNRTAAETASLFTVHACTDITGFGLLGHLYELAAASGVRLEIDSAALPLLPDAPEAANMGLVPAGAYTNRNYLTTVTIDSTVPVYIRDLCYDPQTSGGLLFSLPEAEASELLAALKQANITAAALIGRVVGPGRGEIHVK